MRIASVGRYLPDRVVTAEELAPLLNVDPEWIIEKAGVAERRWVDGESPVEMASWASEEALKKADLEAEDIDLIIHAAATPHQFIPDTAVLVQRELGLGMSGIKSFSVHSTCLSFLTAFEIAASHIAAGIHENVLITSADIGSVGIDYSEPESAALLGDMATAVVVTGNHDSDSAIRSFVFRTYGEGADLCRVEGGYARHPNDPATKPEDFLFHMDGPAIFEMALNLFPPIIGQALVEADVAVEDVDMVIPHQASLLAIKVLQRAFGVRDDQILINIDRYGNCVAASLPGALYDAVEDGLISRGDTLFLAGTGAGLSMAASVLTW